MDFYSMSNRPQTIPMPKTSIFEPEYMEEIDSKTGKTILKKTGEINVYERIQASKDSCSIDLILDKYKNVVDAKTIFNIRKDFVDFTDMPDNPIEAHNLLIRAARSFDNAPEELRKEFNNSFGEYLAAAQNGKLAAYLASKQSVSEPVVNEQPVQQQNNNNGGERLNYGE